MYGCGGRLGIHWRTAAARTTRRSCQFSSGRLPTRRTARCGAGWSGLRSRLWRNATVKTRCAQLTRLSRSTAAATSAARRAAACVPITIRNSPAAAARDASPRFVSGVMGKRHNFPQIVRRGGAFLSLILLPIGSWLAPIPQQADLQAEQISTLHVSPAIQNF